MKKKFAIILMISALTTMCVAGCGNKNEGEVTPTPTTPVQATETPAPTEKPAVTDDISQTKVTLGQYKGLTLHEVDSEEVAKELI